MLSMGKWWDRKEKRRVERVCMLEEARYKE